MRTVPMASKKLKESDGIIGLMDARRLSLCEDEDIGSGFDELAPLKRKLDDALVGMAVEDKERRPVSGGARPGDEAVLLRFRWWRFVLLYRRGMHGKSAPWSSCEWTCDGPGISAISAALVFCAEMLRRRCGCLPLAMRTESRRLALPKDGDRGRFAIVGV